MKKKGYLCLLLVLCVNFSACGKKEDTTKVLVSENNTNVVASMNSISENVVKNETISEDSATKKTDNLISNSEFNDGVGKFGTYLEGGAATLLVNEKGELETDITSIGNLDYSVQVFLDEFSLEEGCEYQMSFDISASKVRDVEWRIQLNGGDYHAYVSKVISLNQDTQHFETTFKMEEATDPAPRMCFNLGLRPGIEHIGEHKIYFDNMKLVLLDDSNKVKTDTMEEVPDINLNQIGYFPNDKKTAVFRFENSATEFDIVDINTGKEVFTGKIGPFASYESTGEKSAMGDFSDFKTPGTYKIVVGDSEESFSFSIADNVYDELLKQSLKMFYLQRCGEDLVSEYAGSVAHRACHTQKAVVYGTDQTIDVSGGWHDAGDYGRYVVPGAKAVADLLYAYEKNPDRFGDETGIPESGNKVPDILDEARYEIEWMLKMQDEKSGGVYHKVSTATFSGEIMPQDETQTLVVAPISTCATGDFAAVMALTARIYKETDPDFSKKCLLSSQRAMQYLSKNGGGSGFKNPSDIVTGEYPDSNDMDERFWALVELYRATLDKEYETELKKIDLTAISPGYGWDNMGFYGINSYLQIQNSDQKYKTKLINKMDQVAMELQKNAANDGYVSTIASTYSWGSNMSVANNAILLMNLDSISKKEEYRNLAKQQLDYLLGENATSYCFVTGFGSMSPISVHHRPSQTTNQVVTGMLVGGPNSNLEDPFAQATLQGVPIAKCYVDNEQSYSCNEVTIYWNSAIVYLLAELLP